MIQKLKGLIRGMTKKKNNKRKKKNQKQKVSLKTRIKEKLIGIIVFIIFFGVLILISYADDFIYQNYRFSFLEILDDLFDASWAFFVFLLSLASIGMAIYGVKEIIKPKQKEKRTITRMIGLSFAILFFGVFGIFIGLWSTDIMMDFIDYYF